jgi:2TM domain
MSTNTRHIPVTTVTSPARRATLQVSRWVLMILGGIAAFMGLFILVGDEEQYIGIGGDYSWQVGLVDPLWGWGLLIGGALFLIGGVLLVLRDRGRRPVPGEVESSPGVDLLVHSVIFVLVNSFLWIQDIVVTGELNYALWVTLPWAVGLGIHALTVVLDKRR